MHYSEHRYEVGEISAGGRGSPIPTFVLNGDFSTALGLVAIVRCGPIKRNDHSSIVPLLAWRFSTGLSDPKDSIPIGPAELDTAARRKGGLCVRRALERPVREAPRNSAMDRREHPALQEGHGCVSRRGGELGCAVGRRAARDPRGRRGGVARGVDRPLSCAGVRDTSLRGDRRDSLVPQVYGDWPPGNFDATLLGCDNDVLSPVLTMQGAGAPDGSGRLLDATSATSLIIRDVWNGCGLWKDP